MRGLSARDLAGVSQGHLETLGQRNSRGGAKARVDGLSKFREQLEVYLVA